MAEATSKQYAWNVVPYTPPSAVTNGEVLVIGGKVYVASMGIAANAPGLIYSAGVFEFAKGTTAASIAVGDSLYWNDSSNVATNSTVGTTLIGPAWEAAGTASGTILGRIIH